MLFTCSGLKYRFHHLLPLADSVHLLISSNNSFHLKWLIKGLKEIMPVKNLAGPGNSAATLGFPDGFPAGSAVKNPPANAGDRRVRSLGQEEPLEEGVATHSSILAWRIPWTKEPGRLHSMGSHRIGHD